MRVLANAAKIVSTFYADASAPLLHRGESTVELADACGNACGSVRKNVRTASMFPVRAR